MFNAKQTRLMNTLGIVSDKDRYDTYEAYCEVEGEMRANGCPAGTFTNYLERKVMIAEFNAKRKAQKIVDVLA